MKDEEPRGGFLMTVIVSVGAVAVLYGALWVVHAVWEQMK